MFIILLADTVEYETEKGIKSMKILSINQNYNYAQKQKQQNFGATTVLAKDIKGLKKFCPTATLLTDESLYKDLWRGLREQVLDSVEQAQDEFLTSHYGDSLKDRRLKALTPQVFLEGEDKPPFLHVLREADNEIAREPSSLGIYDIFKRRWDNKEGYCGILRYVVEGLLYGRPNI